MSSLRPTDGARFLLERADAADAAARCAYRAVIYTPAAEYAAAVELREDGEVAVAPTGAGDELDAALTMFARLTARGAAKRRADGLEPWPARVLRWRP